VHNARAAGEHSAQQAERPEVLLRASAEKREIFLGDTEAKEAVDIAQAAERGRTEETVQCAGEQEAQGHAVHRV